MSELADILNKRLQRRAIERSLVQEKPCAYAVPGDVLLLGCGKKAQLWKCTDEKYGPVCPPKGWPVQHCLSGCNRRTTPT